MAVHRGPYHRCGNRHPAYRWNPSVGTAALINTGAIIGNPTSAGIGVYLAAGGSVTNQITGTITGGNNVIGIGGAGIL